MVAESRQNTNNWITRVNYSPRIKGAFAASALLTEAIVTTIVTHQTPVQEAGLNIAGAELFAATGGLIKMIHNRDNVFLESGLTLGAALLWGQYMGAVGAGVWLLIDSAAKALYDSGITKPMYKALRINDRRRR